MVIRVFALSNYTYQHHTELNTNIKSVEEILLYADRNALNYSIESILRE